MGGGVGVAAGDGHTRLGEAQFGGNHMHDSLAAAAEAMQRDAVVAAVALEGGEHLLSQGISEGARLGCGGHDVINRGHGALGESHRQAQIFQGCKGLGAGHLMNQVQTDKQLGGAARQLGHPMQIPDLVVEGAGTHARSVRLSLKPKAAPRGSRPAAGASDGAPRR